MSGQDLLYELRDSLKKIDYTCSVLFLMDCKARSIMNTLERDLQNIKSLNESQVESKLRGLKDDAKNLYSTLAGLIVYLKGAKSEIERKLG